ncbi:DoxX family protein [Kordia sp. YSTF-M3]|uniref:DoxX family protein n=1 Tax=Kordia aestuariivivens TaxID=2759037 RepID=A0ABR7QC60_9FLAO|nr:DoxX family membrane protein [Kordia aestuariivivens]MBC8756160.1 DoxX family protein [Kordia aestuariivivens]
MKKYVPIIIRIAVAVILIQTLRFKLTAHQDSVYIFEQVGLEPFGRIGIGVAELIAGVLILIPRTAWLGATLTLGIIGGAILMHLTQLGIEVPFEGKPDGGTLFITAIVVFILSAITLWLQRKNIPIIGKKF